MWPLTVRCQTFRTFSDNWNHLWSVFCRGVQVVYFLTQRASWCLRGCKHDIQGLCPARDLNTCPPPPPLSLCLIMFSVSLRCKLSQKKKKRNLKCHTHRKKKKIKAQWSPTKSRFGIDCRMCSFCLRNPPTQDISTINCAPVMTENTDYEIAPSLI